jgi:hypothetical protein
MHPAVLEKSADLVGGKRVLEHSLVKERKERAKSGVGILHTRVLKRVSIERACGKRSL